MRKLIPMLAVALLAAVACGGDEEAEPLTPEQTRTYFANIDSLLDRVVAEHAEGNADQAAELAGQAYLDNYEFLEHDLQEVDAELNEEIEGLLGPPFRRAIQQGMSQEELESRVNEIRTLLEEAESALGVA